jgi:hypothetical protein
MNTLIVNVTFAPSDEIFNYSTIKEGYRVYRQNKLVQHAHLYHDVQKAKTIKR